MSQRYTKSKPKANQTNAPKRVPPVRPAEFDISKLSFDPFAENERVKAQYISFPRYNNNGQSQAVFVTDWFFMETYGIPNIEEYIKNPSDKEKIRVPLNPNGPTPNLDFIKMLDEIDKLALESVPGCFTDSKCLLDARTKRLSKAKLSFSGLHRKPQGQMVVPDDEDEDQDAEQEPEPDNKKQKPDYFTVKMEKNFEQNTISTPIYITKPDPKDPTKDLPPVREYMKDMYEIEKVITWRCKIRMVVQISKLWIKKQIDTKSKLLECGLTMKVKQIEIKPAEGFAGTGATTFEDYAFGSNKDAENENDDDNKDENNKDDANEVLTDENQEDNNSVEQENDESDPVSDPEAEPEPDQIEEPVPEPVKKPVIKKKTAK